jgi:hypothetical protein
MIRSLHCVLIFVFISETILATYSTRTIFINISVSVIIEVDTPVRTYIIFVWLVTPCDSSVGIATAYGLDGPGI